METRHRFSLFYRLAPIVCAPFLVLLGIAGGLDVMTDPPPRGGVISYAILLGLAGVMVIGGLCLIAFSIIANRYQVHLSEFGIRMGAAERWITWAEINCVRARPLLQRMDLLGQQGELLASVEYHIEGGDDVVRAIRAKVPRQWTAGMEIKSRYGNRLHSRLMLSLLHLVFGSFFVAIWLADEERPWWFLAAGAGFLGLVSLHGRGEVVQLDLHDDVLVMCSRLRSSRIHRGEIADVELSLEGDWDVKTERCMIILADGSRIDPTPVGSDPQSVYRAICQWRQAPRE